MLSVHSTTKKKPFEKFIGKLRAQDGRLVAGWLREENVVAVYATLEGVGSVGFALGHLTDMDPLGEHPRPYVLDFVYVSSHLRRQRIGTKVMMDFLAKVDYQCTAFCVDKEAAAFHESCGFRRGQESGQVTMMRHAYRLRVDRSPGKGLGVFAVTNFKRGELVAMYPDIDAETEHRQDEYLLHVGDKIYTGRPWAGDVPSFVTSASSKVAHLFNDGAKLVCRDAWPGLPAWCDDANDYMEKSSLSANVTNDGLRFVAKRDIAAGEEVLYCYGAVYWTDRIYQASYIGKLMILGSQEMAMADQLRIILKPTPRVYEHHNVNVVICIAYMSMSAIMMGKDVPSQVATALSVEIGECVEQLREPMTRDQLLRWQMRMGHAMDGFNAVRSMEDRPEEERRNIAERIRSGVM
jgi:predicted N-acetyltransferase YhbS